jgi:glycerol-3-phosphate dehydrogenase (NAD(P)+)
MFNDQEKIAVLGAGAWGTALAQVLSNKGYQVSLWARESEVVSDINSKHLNSLFLPGFTLHQKIICTNNIEEAVANAGLIVVVIPSQFVRETLTPLSQVIQKGQVIVSATKGIERETLLTPSRILVQTIPNLVEENVAVLSGPSFAKEVVQNIPTAVSLACRNEELRGELQKVFHTDTFRTYTTSDVIGVELGGALKNVLAIAVGLCDGLGFGANARAALMTRGLAEITRLGIAMGAKPKTFSGLAGLGDMILTCTSDLSRNRTVGKKVAQGNSPEKIAEEMIQVAEGMETSSSTYRLSKQQAVEMPIMEQIYLILHERKSAHQAMKDLISRNPKKEFY